MSKNRSCAATLYGVLIESFDIMSEIRVQISCTRDKHSYESIIWPFGLKTETATLHVH